MLQVIALVIAALLDFTYSGVLDKSPLCQLTSNDTSYRYLYAVFRHGIRSPLYEPYPNDPNKERFHKYFSGSLGKLTKVGKRQMYQVGKMLKKRYQDFLGEYSEDTMKITSTNKSRTIITALSVMAGLFPPTTELFHNLNWQPIPVWCDTTEFDKAYIYNDENFPELGLRICPPYGALIKKGYDIIRNPDKTKGRYEIYKLVRKYTGNPNVTSVDSMYGIFDVMQMEELNGLPQPEWATWPQKCCGNLPLYPDLISSISNEWFTDTEYLFNNEKMLRFYSGPMFNSIHKALLKKSQDPLSEEVFRFHATHDSTLYAILWGMGLREPSSIAPGDGILFELHEEESQFHVKILYYNGVLRTLEELQLPECPSPCALQKFIEASPALTPLQWQQRCNS